VFSTHFMFRDELDVLEMRLTALERCDMVEHVLVESPVTHRGFGKPLVFAENKDQFGKWLPRVTQVVAPVIDAAPWVVEHAQRNAAWTYINDVAKNSDIVFICDVDEIPAQPMLEWRGDQPVAVRMRTCIFAVDWEVTTPIPPTCVIASVGYLRLQATYGAGLAEVRDGRGLYPELADGGWHLSWLGGPERQREKLATGTCHTELLTSPEGALIASGARWRSSEDGGGLAVKPVDVDDSWPVYVYDRRCPASWFRPR
jgi:beta-1,4-mannosyl-glycoprotein beta-1,4-N-acetylglucosaminyltransferase